MRATEFMEDTDFAPTAALAQGIGNLYDKGAKAFTTATDRVTDYVQKDDIARMQPLCARILGQIKTVIRNEIQAQVQRKQAQQYHVQLMDKILDKITVRVGTNSAHGTSATGYEIAVDSSTDYVLDEAGLTWSMAHEAGHILHWSYYQTWARDIQKDPQSGEKIADAIATTVTKRLGYNGAEVFNKVNSKLLYWYMNRPETSSLGDTHPTVYQRRKSAGEQGFNLSNPDDSTVQQPGMATAPA